MPENQRNSDRMPGDPKLYLRLIETLKIEMKAETFKSNRFKELYLHSRTPQLPLQAEGHIELAPNTPAAGHAQDESQEAEDATELFGANNVRRTPRHHQSPTAQDEPGRQFPNIASDRPSIAVGSSGQEAPGVSARHSLAFLLSTIPPLPLAPNVANIAHSTLRVVRGTTSQLFGGDPISARPRPGPSGLHQLYVDIGLNPYAPLAPGLPGLLFHAGEYDAERPEDPEHTFIGKGQGSVQQYCGRYELVALGPEYRQLTREEWLSLPESVKARWVQTIKRMRRDWQRTVAARIHLRASTSVREPSAALVRRKAGQIKTKAMSFDAKLIRVAFDDGEERLQVLGMRCVSYDVEIQQKIMEAMLQE